uniref:Uncharacterized protein n=1 Tax=Pan troglodytes TaxID=9598 RepID=A0A2I3S220_PANTR
MWIYSKLSKRTVFRKGKTRTQKTLGITTTPKCFRLQEITIHVFAGGHTIFPYYLVQNDSSLPKSFFSNHDFPTYFGPMQSHSLWPIVSLPTTPLGGKKKKKRNSL